MASEFLGKIEKTDEGNQPPKKKFSEIILSRDFVVLFLIFLVALAVRLYSLYFLTNSQNAGVGWYGDTYHHWQIAYLSKEIGFHQGFLRLWDFKGMEYFWGLLHPLILAALMTITGSTDIVLTRILSAVAGSLAIVFFFLITKRHWGMKVAVATAILGALNPVGVFNDASGMVEPLGILFLLGAIYFWPKRPVLTALLFAFASMARAEYWLFSSFLIFAALLFTKQRFDKKATMLFSYLVAITLYMKYLLTYTGNPIYPIWWNFLGNAAGKWQANVPLTVAQVMVRPIWITMFILSLIGVFWILYKKPRGLLIHLLGLVNFLFLGFLVGLTAYVKSYVHYFWVVRIFILPYLYLSLLIALLLFVVVPKFVPFFSKLRLGWIFTLAILVSSQLAWRVIWLYYRPTQENWVKEVKLASDVASYYRGGTILIDEEDPVMIYSLVRTARIKARNIQGEKYDPFEYEPFALYTDLFQNWSDDRQIILRWLKEDNIKLLIFPKNRERYLRLVKKEPQLFKFLKEGNFGRLIYAVKI